MRQRQITTAACLLALVLAGTAAHADPTNEIEGVTFNRFYRVGNTTLPLRGLGLARYLFTIKVYAAALYIVLQLLDRAGYSAGPRRGGPGRRRSVRLVARRVVDAVAASQRPGSRDRRRAPRKETTIAQEVVIRAMKQLGKIQGRLCVVAFLLAKASWSATTEGRMGRIIWV